MKRHLSILMLAARSTIYKVLGVFAAMAAAEGALFWFALQKMSGGDPVGLEQLISQSRIPIVCGIGFLLLCALLSMTGSESGGGKLRYTVRRLSVREKALVFWWAGYYAVCFFLFWAVQLIIALLLCRLYVTQMDPAYVSGQTIFLAFYRSSFLHSLLPLEETSRYIRNGILILSLGICASCFSFRQRRGEKGIAVAVLAVVILVSFSTAMGSFAGDMLLSMTVICITAGAVSGIWKERVGENGF